MRLIKGSWRRLFVWRRIRNVGVGGLTSSVGEGDGGFVLYDPPLMNSQEGAAGMKGWKRIRIVLGEQRGIESC